MKRMVTFLVALSMVASVALPLQARAQTVAELQAQINSLLNLVSQLQATLLALQSGGTGQGIVFTENLALGSRGPQVSRLQAFLVSNGFLTMPPGVAFGYFGPLTQSAVMQFQASKNIIPAAGFFGPITRALVNALVNVPPGTGTGGPVGGGITTPGVEGSMSITSYNVGLRSTVYEGEDAVPVLGARITARQSDIAVQRVRVNLGNSSRIYNRILSRLYVTDGTNVLASTDLNSSTVTRDGSTYYVTLLGFNYIVPKDASRNLVIKADVRPAIDSVDRDVSYTIQLADNGVRAVDGMGIDLYGPNSGSSLSRSFLVQQSLAESASLSIFLDMNTPRNQEIIADSGANNNERDGATMLMFGITASRDDITLTDLRVNVSKTGSGTATAQTAYLYSGSTQINNAPVSGGIALFQNLDYAIPANTTRILTIKLDLRNASADSANFVVSVPASGIEAENSFGDLISSSNISGSATGYQIGVRNVGSSIALVSQSVTSYGVPQRSDETSAITTTFNVRIRATGGDLILGLPGSSTPAFDSGSFTVYINGEATTVDNSAKSLSYSTPSGATTAGLTNSFRIPEGSEVTMPVTFQLRGRTSGGTALASGLYAIGLEEINWVADGTSQTISFMAGDSAWRTTDVSFP